MVFGGIQEEKDRKEIWVFQGMQASMGLMGGMDAEDIMQFATCRQSYNVKMIGV